MARPTCARLDPIFKAYDIRGTVPDQLDAEHRRADRRRLRRLRGRRRRPRRPGPRRPGHAAQRRRASPTPSPEGVTGQGVDVVDLGLALHRPASTSPPAASTRPAPCSPPRTTRPSTTASSSCLAGARPVGEDTGLDRDQGDWPPPGVDPAADHRARSREQDAARRLRRPRRTRSSTSSALQPAEGRGRHGQRHGRAGRPGGVRRPAVRPRDHVRRARRHLPQPPRRPDPAREPASTSRPGCSRPAPTSAWPSTATPTGCSSSTTQGAARVGLAHHGHRRRRRCSTRTRAPRSSTT